MKRLEIAVAVALAALCLALPSGNPSGDAWYYAACARWGQELWQPHHLLYNAAGRGWLLLWQATGPAPAGQAALGLLQALNALAAGGCLLVLAPLLRRAGARPAAVPAWLLLVGSCFGLLRFATDNEAYVLPLLPALLASYWVSGFWFLVSGSHTPVNQELRTRNQKPATRNLLAAGLCAALACLLHQMLVWWWLGLLLGLQPWQPGRRRAALAYAAPALLVPLAYALAAPGGPATLLPFALHDYLSGAASPGPSARSLLLTPISLVRTLTQVHGNLLPLLRHWPLPLGAVAATCAVLAGYGLWGIVRPKRPRAAVPGAAGVAVAAPLVPAAVSILPATVPVRVPSAVWSAGSARVARHLRRTHLLILGLHLAFAAYSAGNAEFMAMLPALAAAVLAGGAALTWPARRVAALALALLTWNLAFALLPAHFLVYTDASPALRARVLGQPRAWFLLADPNLLRNQLHYYTGRPDAAPRIVGLVGQRPARFRPWLLARLAAGDAVYTDALGGPHLLDRARLTLGDPAAPLLAGLPARRVAALPTFFGPYYLSRLALPAPDTTRATQSKVAASAPTNTGAAR